MSNQSKFHHDYSLATNQLAKQIWYKYPEIVRQCVDHVDFIKDNLLKNAISGHMGAEQINYWYDDRLAVLAQNRNWIRNNDLKISPTDLEINRMMIGSAPRLIRWLTSDLYRAHEEEVQNLIKLHFKMVNDELERAIDADSAESYDFISELVLPVENNVKIPGRGWIDLGPPMAPLTSSEDSDWVTPLVTSAIAAPVSIRKSIRHYADTIDRHCGGNKDEDLAKTSIQDAINTIFAESLIPLSNTIFEDASNSKDDKFLHFQAYYWAKFIASGYHFSGKNTIWHKHKDIEYFKIGSAKVKLLTWIRNQNRVAWSDKSSSNRHVEIDIEEFNKNMYSLWNDGSKVDEYILGKLGILEKLEKSKSIMLRANKENENKIVNVSALEKINALTGLEPIKSYARNLIALNEIDKKRKAQGLPVVSVNRHLVLLGNPGTGKTTSARLLGELFKELGILSKGHFVEVGQQDLIAEYVGQTAKKTNDAIQKAKGGVLFIDEAYSLAGKNRGGYGAEAVEVLVKEMENLKDDFVLIVAGYQSEMEQFLSANEGLRSRFSQKIFLPDMSNSELFEVTNSILNQQKYALDDSAKDTLLKLFANTARTKGFANARFARQIAEDIKTKQSLRLIKDDKADLSLILSQDIPIKNFGDLDTEIKEKNKLRLEIALQKLNALTGLDSIKKEVNSIVSLARIARIRAEKGQDSKPVVGHFVFSGNPGTGKTTVARILGEIFASLGLLSSGHTIEAGKSDLIGEYLGQTTPKVKAKVEAALGGVLFIDEAYSLGEKFIHDGFAKEAVETLVQLMENHRNDFVAIFAGYSEEMADFVASNKGLEGRITYKLNFDNYNLEELTEILKSTATANDFILTNEYIKAASLILLQLIKKPNFSNARTVRELFEYSVRQQSLRLNTQESIMIDSKMLRTLTDSDLPDIKEVKVDEKQPFGFN